MSINTDRKEVYDTRDDVTTVSFEYPEHYTQQQRGFTPAGGSKNYFPGLVSGKVKSRRIPFKKYTEEQLIQKLEDKVIRPKRKQN